MLKVVPLRFGTMFKKAFGDHEVFSRFASDVLGLPIHVDVVHQEYRYPNAVGPVNVTYDLFAEDVEHRVVVEVQHIRENDFFERFLHYHAVGIVEQPRPGIGAGYQVERRVCTVVVLTTEPRDHKLDFSVAVSDMDPVSEKGKRLGVYHHRLVFLNAKNVNADTPPAARAWMELITDSLDGQIDDSRYPDPLMQRVLGAIRDDRLTPDELAQVLDEGAWEQTKRETRQEGVREGAREGALRASREILTKLARASGLALSEADVARIEACTDAETLERWILRAPGAKQVSDVLD